MSDSQKATPPDYEVSNDSSFSLTGAIDANPVINQMKAPLRMGIAGGLDDLNQDHAFWAQFLPLTAASRFPAGVVVPANPTVTTSGLGDL